MKRRKHLLKTDTKKSQLIKVISTASDRYGDKLLDFMETYQLTGLNNASTMQLEEYIEKNNLK